MTDFAPICFEDLCNLLLPLGALNSPAELHGLLCGKLSGGESPGETRWLLDAVEFLDFTQAPDESVRFALTRLYDDSLAQLRGESFALKLLLPEDDNDIGERLTALGQWCYGFLTGFGSVGAERKALTEEAQDMLRDLASIAQIQADEDDGENAEADYMEVTEYVRMAASSLYLEYAAPVADAEAPAAEQQPSTLH